MEPIRIQVLQHEAFEGAGLIEDWAMARGYQLTVTHVYKSEPLPAVESFNWLVIMGGAMSVNDEAIYPWLKPEKVFIKNAIDNGKTVIGICLGAQLIANALGKKVSKNEFKEIGWFPVMLTEISDASPLSPNWHNQTFFHWHGETFELPVGAKHLAYSMGCKNQAFSIGDRVFGFQFHPETNNQTVNQMVSAGSAELVKDTYVMEPAQALSGAANIDKIRLLFFDLLDKLAITMPALAK